MSTRLAIHVWTDLSSPRSFRGLKNLLEATEGKHVAIEHHAFFTPDNLKPGADDEYLTALRDAGLDITGSYMSDNRKAQELIYAAKEQGSSPEDAAKRGLEMAVGLHEAALLRGEDISSIDTLLTYAKKVGLDESEVRDGLEQGRWSKQVDGDVADAGRIGMVQAPFLFLSGLYLLEGPQSVNAIAALVNEALGELEEREKAAEAEARELFGWQG